ncbi:hypothetical protein ABT061_43420 [Streptosporangium sp. NPDC002544]|uniref:hypothetical protein n=1 Tax=Streptosporangium sp. NPDC002544 TaxID=3154538 RepID=UPI003332D162
MTLVRPVEDWPLLICGPIMRRVTKDEVAVFVATKRSCSIRLVVYEPGKNNPSQQATPVQTRALGAALHVAVCHLTVTGNRLQPGVVYAYDLHLTPTGTGDTETLADQPGLLSGEYPLGYLPDSLPSFALAPGLASLNIVHSSCRKPHGGGQDALVMVDLLIERSRDAANERPHQLLLTGDQIYADDVALTMLHTLQEAAGLLGVQPAEEFPGSVRVTSDQVKPGGPREAYLKTKSTKKPILSSSESVNHLMFFAEFCAMYVMVWSDELWPRDSAGRPSLGGVAGEQRCVRRDLSDFVRTLRRARRALANAPTMMMFDDHEISDDWNIDREWFDNTRSDEVLRQIVRNGLLAFGVFQAWGNEPARFAAGAPAKLLQLVTVPAGGAAPIAGDPGAADILLDLTVKEGERMTWDWSIDGEEHRVIALDSRTRRDYVSKGPKRPGLLRAEEVERQLIARRPKPPGDRLCLVIAPAPVFGHPLVERVVQPLLALGGLFGGNRRADQENWAINQVTYQRLLRELAEFGRVVLLSGDVHYAFTMQIAYFGPGGQNPARILQLCSSSAKNAEGKTRAIQFIGYLGDQGEGWLGFADGLSAVDRVLLTVALERPQVHDLIEPLQQILIRRTKACDLLGTPALVPTGPWGDPIALLRVSQLAKAADWSYQVSFLTDRRPGDRRLGDAAQADPRTPPEMAVDEIRNAHRAVVGEPNIGQILFRTVGGRPFLAHRLHWMTGGKPEESAQTFTLHLAPLYPPGPDERPEPFFL